MAYSATVFNVLIASPSDVEEEREAIAQTIHDWNSLNSAETGKVLLPVRWESHSAPVMGDRPQGIINEQVVRDCDILIGAFWTRLGSPTGVEDSGTVEEIKLFLKQQKPVMLYYSKKPVDMDEADLAQVQKLKDFKKSIRNKGIQEQYCNIDELKQKLMRQLTIVMRGISVGTHVTATVVKEAKAAKVEQVANSGIEETLLEADDPIKLVNYTDKAFVVVGNTIDHKDELQAANGKWIKLKFGGYGWMFSKKRINVVAGILAVAPELSEN
ncbi:DUF4062 domain-containing protein [Shewanella algae]|uniref:DUF4062 domain-containing protein n=1 Tax=Shewanella algae TaxID=38313 RepID=UPI001F3537CB|nr:DUF4062 domain-containing protein [Shewanella algae]MCE9777547.1 DUF4062 domain-containing protein [Shewanella algae]